MANPTPRRFEYSVSLDGAWTGTSDRGGEPLPHDEEAWTPEHLLLVALARCTLTSLAYHARRAGLVATARAEAAGTVTARETDGRFAFVELEVTGHVALEPPQPEDAVRALLEKAERDCFVGASLTPAPAYTWHVNGQEVEVG